ncbi:MAG TPA: SCP2 sterol-binding domain-containing protein [Polyangiaceae bacterium]
MLPIEIPAGTTATVLVTEIVPALHAKMVPADAPADAFAVALRIEDEGSWTVRVRGARMTVSEGDEPGVAPALWMWTTARAVERFLDDATGEKRLLPKFGPVGGVATMSDPRVLKRVAMASGRIELALVDERGERLGIVFGFGAAAKKAIDPEDADTVIEADLATVERVLRGELGPEDALADGNVRVKGNRLLAMQLALAVAPFYPGK